MSETRKYDLEKAAAAVVEYLSQGPPLYQLPLEEARKAIDGAQPDVAASRTDVEETWVTVPADAGDVRVLIIKPRAAKAQLPAVLYMHGGGWVFGSARSHGRLAADLSVASGAAVLFIEYALAPKPSTRCRSSSATPSPAGSPSRAKATGSTRHGSPSPATRPEATWRPCSASWRRSAGT
jgi:acetyl esterase/lipase